MDYQKDSFGCSHEIGFLVGWLQTVIVRCLVGFDFQLGVVYSYVYWGMYLEKNFVWGVVGLQIFEEEEHSIRREWCYPLTNAVFFAVEQNQR